MEQISWKVYERQILTLLPVFVSSFITGCTMGWVADTTSPSDRSFASSTQLGRLILAIPSGIIVDRLGRKKVTIGFGVLNIICWVLISSFSSESIILFSRFSLGMNMAIMDATAWVVIGEVASHSIRGQLVGINYIFITGGELFQSIILISFSSYSVLEYSFLAVACIFFVSLFWIIETPHYLISESKMEKARENLKHIRPHYTEEEIDSEFADMQTYVLSEKRDGFEFLNSKSIRKPLCTGILISLVTLAIDPGSVINYITLEIVNDTTMPSEYYPFDIPPEYYPMITQLSSFILSVVAPLYVEKFPRRTIYLMGAALIYSTNVILALTDYFYVKLKTDIFKKIMAFVLLLQKMISSGSVQQMHDAMKSELFPHSVKGFGSALCEFVQSLVDRILCYIYDIFTTDDEQYYIFIILAANSLILCFLIYFRLPEARKLRLTNLQTKSDERITTASSPPPNYESVEREEI